MFTLCRNSADFIDSVDLLLKIIGGAGALTVFIIGVRRYGKEQVWRRNEFLAKEIKEFYADKMVQNALCMIDWGERDIELFPDETDYSKRFVKVNRDSLNKALIFHELLKIVDGQPRFSLAEAKIRDSFDRLFDQLERFEQFLLNGLILENELLPYLEYVICDIADKDNDLGEETRELLFNYIDAYRFKGVQSLFARYGKDTTPKVKSLDLLKHQKSGKL